ncbi:hypothetical protein HaLaN_11714 [Haematococcus lacustris]|uniref:Uncharacterized protein n=1 Tax=Haematococcus lacustris TaxID=44745 RepID=A0A699Z8N6_HAELA|nr:hypothetical protein HaLaN_11714 [Haematococcus lacustris]
MLPVAWCLRHIAGGMVLEAYCWWHGARGMLLVAWWPTGGSHSFPPASRQPSSHPSGQTTGTPSRRWFTRTESRSA